MQIDDKTYMMLALQEAQNAAQEGEVPIGAVIVCDGKVIARAHNLTETLNDVTAHAEMQAITMAANTLGGKYLNRCTLYVTVEPCLMCAGAIGWSQMKRVVFGAPDDKRGSHTFCCKSPYHKKTEVTEGILADRCAAIITDFFKKKR